MLSYNTPQEHYALLKKHLLPALRHCCAPDQDPKELILKGINPCLDCPYFDGPLADPCEHHFIMLLPEILRSYPDLRAASLADRLDICNAVLAGEDREDDCCECPHYDICRLEEDLDPIIQESYTLLKDLGAYDENT